MNVTVEHIVIAVVALALIYTIVQHRNVNLIEPNLGDTLLDLGSQIQNVILPHDLSNAYHEAE